MADYDWSRFCKRITVRADTRIIYESWTTRQNIERWFLRLAEFRSGDGTLRSGNEPVQAGDTYKWQWHGYPDEIVENGEILVANGHDLLQFTFSKSTVSVQIKMEDSETVVELWQESIPIDEIGKTTIHLGCSEGWTFYLANLKSILEGGIDLRNRNANIKKLVSS